MSRETYWNRWNNYQNGYGVVLPFLGRDSHNLFILAEKVNTLFPWPGIAHDEYLAEQENGVKVPALPAL